MESVLKFLTTPHFMTLACSFIGCFFGICLIQCRRRRDYINLGISQGIEAIVSAHNRRPSISRTLNFARNIGTVSKAIAGNALLKEKWTEFRDSLFVRDGGCQAAMASLPAESFFSEDGFLLRHYNERFFSAVPNILTGMGILGTFMGLMAGIQLTDISAMLILHSLADPLKGNPLLDAAGLVFYTSILGLGFSIIFSLAEKRFYREAVLSLATFTELLDSLVVRYSPEVLAMKQLNLLNDLRDIPMDGGRQGLAVRTELGGSVVPFIAGFEESAGKVLATNVTESLKPELVRIAGTLDDIHHNRSHESTEAVKILVNSFLESLQGATHAAVESVAESLRLVAVECNPITDNLKEANRIIAGNIEAARIVAVDMVKISSELSSVSSSLANLAQQADGSVLGLAAAVEGAALKYAEITENLDLTVTRTLEGQTAAVELLNEELGRLGDCIGVRMDGAEKRMEGLFVSAEERMAESQAEIQKSVEEAAASVAETAAIRITDAGEGLKASFTALSSILFDRAAERVDEFGEMVVSEIAKLPSEAERIAGGVSSRIDEIAAGLDRTLVEVRERQDNVGAAVLVKIDAFGSSLVKAIGMAEEHHKELDSSLMWNMDSLAEGLNAMISKALTGLGEFQDATHVKIDEVGAGLMTALSASASDQHVLQDSMLAKIGEINTGMNGIFDSVKERQLEINSAVRTQITEAGSLINGTIVSLKEGQNELNFALLGRIDEASKSFESLLGGVMKTQGELHSSMLGKIYESGESVRKAISGIADAQTGVYTQILSRLELYNTQFEDILSKAPGGIDGLVGQLRGSLNRLEGEISSLYVQTADSFKDTAKEVNDRTLEFIENQRTVLEKHNGTLESLMLNQRGGIDAINDAVQMMLRKFYDHVSFMDDSYGKHNDMYDRQIKGVKDSLDAIQSLWDSYNSRLDGVDNVLARTLDKLQDSYLHNISQAERFLHEIDGSFASAVAELKVVIGQIGSRSS
jgi:hypothetical protein